MVKFDNFRKYELWDFFEKKSKIHGRAARAYNYYARGYLIRLRLFYYACDYCFDLMLCEKKIDFNFEKVSERVQMLSKT